MNKYIRKNSKKMTSYAVRKNNHSILSQFPVKIVFTWMIYLAVILSLQSMFQLKSVTFYSSIPGLVLIFFLYMFRSIKVRMVLVLLWVVGLLILFFEGNGYLIQGMLSLWNQVAETMGIHTGNVYPQYDVTLDRGHLAFAVCLFWGNFACILAWFCFFAVERSRNFLLWVMIVPLFVIQLVIGVTPALHLNLLLLLSAVLLMNYTFIHRREKRIDHHGGSQSKVFLSTSILLIILFATSIVLIRVLVPEPTYSKPAPVMQLKSMMERQIENFRYEKERTHTFNQGDFTQLGELQFSDEEVLEVVMDKPVSLYLRGFVGEKYTQTRWELLDEEVRYDSYGLFYWLHEEGFSPFRQLSILSELASDEEDETVRVTIHNKNANSKYVYTPYELYSYVEGVDGAKAIGGSTLTSEAFFGDRLYSYEVKENLVKEYPRLANQAYDIKKNGTNRQYFEQESHYNHFVYQHYTDIPEHIANLLSYQLQVAVKGEGQHIPYEEAIDFVRNYLNENLQYNVAVSPIPDDRDFLTHLLEDSRSGYAVHFATAGTIIFRYLGIPARYVEGYLITPDDVADVEAYERVTIPGANAHAWTEIYIDQVGWIPIEVTPPYYNVMEPTDFSDYPLGEAAPSSPPSAYDAVGGSLDSNQEVTDEERFYDMDKQEPPNGIGALAWVLIILTLIILALIGAYLVYAIIKRKQLKDLQTSFHKRPYKDAVSNIFAYSVSLLRYDGFGVAGGSLYQYAHVLEDKYSKNYAEAFKIAASINQEARYSGKDIPEEKFVEMHRFLEDTLKEVSAGKSIWQRLKMRYIDFMY